MPYGNMLHIWLTNLLLLAAKQEPYKKKPISLWKILNFLGKFQQNMASRQKKDRTERVTGLGRKTREETAKWNQMTDLRFQTGEGIRHTWPPFGGIQWDRMVTLQNKTIANQKLYSSEPTEPSSTILWPIIKGWKKITFTHAKKSYR